MLTKKQPENTPITGCLIHIGHGLAAIVDTEDYPALSKYCWRLYKSQNCWYAVRREQRNGATRIIRMHRQIMNTPPGYVPHHKNRCTLDNRKSNLENLTDPQHALAHHKT